MKKLCIRLYSIEVDFYSKKRKKLLFELPFLLRAGHFRQIFDRESGIIHQPVLVPETRVIAVSCGIKISAVHHLVLSQYTRLTDGRTDRQTDRQTELRQQYRVLHYMPQGKNRGLQNCHMHVEALGTYR